MNSYSFSDKTTTIIFYFELFLYKFQILLIYSTSKISIIFLFSRTILIIAIVQFKIS